MSTIVKHFTFYLSFLITVTGFSQTYTVTGTLQDEAGEPLSYATVMLKDTSGVEMIKAELSNNDGEYVIRSVQEGLYIIETSFLGFNNYFSNTITVDQDLEIDPIIMSQDAAQLDEVTITSRRPLIEVQADKTVFNVENTLNASGSDGFELLRKAPGVVIDNNDNIILEGKTGVQIFINGKPSILSADDLKIFLQTLQSTDIDKIEIITQPSSKYDAAGNAGIINIQLKKDKRFGTNGSLSSGYTQGRNGRFNSSVSLNNRGSNYNLYGNYSNSIGQSWNFINLNRIQSGINYDSRSEFLEDRNSHNGRVGLDLFKGDNHTFGFLIDGNLYDGNTDGDTRTPIITNPGASPEQVLVAGSDTENENFNLRFNANYRYADTLGRELTVDMDYGRFSRDRINFQPNTYYDGTEQAILFSRNSRMITPTDIDVITAKVDYSANGLGGKIGVGAKFSYVDTDNTFDFYDVEDQQDVLNQDRSNRFVYSEQINAAYINYNKKWSKFNLQLGLRAEQTISEGDLTSNQELDDSNVKRNYLNLFPSGGLTYTPSYTSMWSLNYSRRIQRPNYQSLNPFEGQLDELSFQKGNPFLQPQYTNNVRLAHTYKYRLTTSISYSFISDFFAQITDTLGTNRNFLQQRNIANQRVINLGISYPFDAAKWWSVYLSVNAFRSSFESDNDKFVAIDQNTLSLYAQNSFRLPKGIRFEVSGWFSSPSVWGGTYQTRSLGSLNLAVQKKFNNDQITMRIAANDILYTSNWRGDTTFGDLYIDGNGGWESRNVVFNVSYTFGSNEVKAARKRETGLEDESSRIQ